MRCVRGKKGLFFDIAWGSECLHLALLFAQNRCLGAREVPKKVGMTHRSLQQCDAMFVCPPNGGQDVCTFGRKLECKCRRSD